MSEQEKRERIILDINRLLWKMPAVFLMKIWRMAKGLSE